jgi:hypothetical protein
LPEVERVSHNSGSSGDSTQRVVQPTVTQNGEKAPALKFGQPRVMAIPGAYLIPSPHRRIPNRDLRVLVVDLLGVTGDDYTAAR